MGIYGKMMNIYIALGARGTKANTGKIGHLRYTNNPIVVMLPTAGIQHIINIHIKTVLGHFNKKS